MARRLIDAQRGLWQAGVSRLQRAGESAFPGGSDGISNAVQGGIKKLEDVFDQRVIAALLRAGMPTVEELQRLGLRVEKLSEQLTDLSKRVGPRKRRV